MRPTFFCLANIFCLSNKQTYVAFITKQPLYNFFWWDVGVRVEWFTNDSVTQAWQATAKQFFKKTKPEPEYKIAITVL